MAACEEIYRRKGLLIRRIPVGLFQANCYMAMNEDSMEGFLIDPGAEPIKIISEINDIGLLPDAVLLTHGHFDHIMAVNELKIKYNTTVYAHEDEQKILKDAELNSSLMSTHMKYTTSADVLLHDGDIIETAGFRIRVIATPGHTIGGVCYLVEDHDIMFTGDTLFYESIGRSDLPTGDSDLLISSIREKLAVLNENIKVFPGHGDMTSIAHEKQHNSFLRSNSLDE